MMRSSAVLVVTMLGLAGCPARPLALDADTSEGEDELGSTGVESSGGEATESEGQPPLDLPASCDVFAQDCPAGYKCTYREPDDPQTLCVPVTGLQHAGDPCTWQGEGIDDCDAVSVCWSWYGVYYECVEFCTGTPTQPQCNDDSECGAGVPGFDLCVQDCSDFEQDCPAGQKCVPYSTGDSYFTYADYTCVPVGGDQQQGEPCQSSGIETMLDDCALGSFCVGPDAWSMMPFAGECALQCTGSPDDPMCPEGQVCELWGQGGPWTCETPCDPLAPNCEDGQSCHWDYYYFYCMPVIGDVPTGGPCSYVTECSPGNFCVDANALLDCAGDACCTSFCALDLGDADCAAQPGTNCVSLFEPDQAPPLYANLGVCVIP
jgi:hypothetical protein